MTRPLIPPRGIFVSSKLLFDKTLPPVVRDTAIQIASLAWGAEETPPVSFSQISELTGKSIPVLYNHMGELRRRGALRWRTAESSTIIVTLLDGVLPPSEDEILQSNSRQLELLDPITPVSIKSTKSKIKNSDSCFQESTPKPRDAMFDAIVSITGVDPSIKSAAASVGKVKRELMQANPPYTPDDVMAFGQWWNKDSWRREHGLACYQITQKIGVIRNGNGNGAGHAVNRTDSSDDEATLECARRINARNGK